MYHPATIRALRLKSWAMIHEISGWVVSEQFRKLNAVLAKYSPDQPRVPAGSSEGGQWTSGDGSGESTILRVVSRDRNNRSTQHRDPDAIEPSYPLETAIAFAFGGEILTAVRGAIGLAEVVAAEEGAAATVAETGLTRHGAVRLSQRNINKAEANEAVRTAKESGNVTVQTGKYGTPQNVYKGSNGITVIEETSGRNAGKVITIYRH